MSTNTSWESHLPAALDPTMSRPMRHGPIVVACLGLALSACTFGAGDESGDETDQVEERTSAVSCAPKLSVFPVRGKHNTGYESANTGKSSTWTCNAEYSNSDYVWNKHLGNDIWAAEGTPVVATTDGKVRH